MKRYSHAADFVGLLSRTFPICWETVPGLPLPSTENVAVNPEACTDSSELNVTYMVPDGAVAAAGATDPERAWIKGELELLPSYTFTKS